MIEHRGLIKLARVALKEGAVQLADGLLREFFFDDEGQVDARCALRDEHDVDVAHGRENFGRDARRVPQALADDADERAVMFDGALPNHFATPPWLEQAPCCDAAFDQVLSPQRAVAVFGMRISFLLLVAAFCALSVAGVVTAAAATANATNDIRIESVRRICFLQLGHSR